MISRRDFLQVGMAASALVGASGFGNWARLAAQQSLTQDQLLEFDTYGNVSLIHVTDIHAQMKPIYFREPSVNLGVGGNKGAVPHLTGAEVMASDIRGGASLIVAGLAAHGTTTIHRVYHVDRGYQEIERRLESLGARIRRVSE